MLSRKEESLAGVPSKGISKGSVIFLYNLIPVEVERSITSGIARAGVRAKGPGGGTIAGATTGGTAAA
jgi:hypothetical protein